MAILSSEIESVLKAHGIPTDPRVIALDAEAAIPVLRKLAGEQGLVVAPSPQEAVRAARTHRIACVVAGGDAAPGLLRALSSENVTISVVAIDPKGDGGSSAQLRAAGVMDVITDLAEGAVEPLVRRAVDFGALLVLELAHRCESRRLLNRELELLGQPPESMSDDLSVFQPPPLPVGPLSVYNLEEASEAFETAYIDRVQQLCASAREAAVYLGVSSATLSRRLRRESTIDGQ